MATLLSLPLELDHGLAVYQLLLVFILLRLEADPGSQAFQLPLVTTRHPPKRRSILPTGILPSREDFSRHKRDVGMNSQWEGGTQGYSRGALLASHGFWCF